MSLRTLGHYVFHPFTLLRRLQYYFYEKRHPDEPWLEPRAVRFLEKNLQPNMTLFEWGSGRSTLWFSKKVKKVVSIEYDRGWFEKVKSMVQEQNIENVDLRHIALEHPKQDPTPKHYNPTPQYVKVIHEFPNQAFDVILIDGHYRWTCADQCLDHLKEGGYLVIDNSNRSAREEWGVPQSWPLLHESENIKTQTSIWKKVSAQ